MKFDWTEPTARMTADDQRRWSATFADVTFACSECLDEDTVETDERVPVGTHCKVRCSNGHVSVGIPPLRFRTPSA